jgi:large subunit ribosomal protein L30
MAKVIVKQTRSLIDRPKVQKDTMKALGLGRIGKTNEIELNPAIEGMIRKVNHLLEVTNV